MTTMQLSENALTVLTTRYLLDNETPEQMFWRVAHAVAQAEERDRDYWAQQFFDLMASCEFMPNSPTLFNAGTGQGTLSACFVIPVDDTMESIMKAASVSAMIQKFGGGIGYSFSRLRGKGSGITTTHGKACGSVAVLKMMSALSDMITQGGKRHGANMGILDISHPEILDFIHMKDDNQTAQNFNISVAVTDLFMEAVTKNQDWELIDPKTKEIRRTLPARQIWNELVESAHKTGDPGLYFIDEANRYNPTPHLGRLESTNPCGEVPLLPFEACNLGSINLNQFVRSDKSDFEMERLEEVVVKTCRFLDDVVTINQFPVAEVKQAVDLTRKIGLGVMGWHDSLIMMGIPYDSDEAITLGDRVMGHINRVAKRTSMDLARNRGAYPGSKDQEPIRNATRTCIAPTGTISVIAGASSGIEPVFALAYVKNVLDGKQLQEINPHLEEIARSRGFFNQNMMDEVMLTGSIQHIAGIPEDVKTLFKTAMEIPYQTHIKMQGVFQQHTDLAVSKTINLPNEASVQDIENSYRMAWALKCRGITVYRDGCKPTQVLEIQNHKRKEPMDQANSADVLPIPRERPSTIQGITERIRTGHGNMYVTINFDGIRDPFELFTTLGKAGGCDSAQLEAISRLTSLALRSGIGADQIVEQLRGITCCPAWDQGTLVRSAPDAMALALAKHLQGPQDETHAAQPPLFPDNSIKTNGRTSSNVMSRAPCPECSSGLVYQEGCWQCGACGWNKCGG